jgi:hypothetical protein
MAPSSTRTAAAPPTADAAMNEALERPDPVAWKPVKAGDQIVGTLLRVEQRTTQYGPAAAMILVDGECVEHSVYLFFESMKTQLDRLRPAAGERVAIRYLGEKPSKNPTPGRKATYHDFKVAVDRPVNAVEVDWSSTFGKTTTAAEPEPDADTEDLPF